MDMSLNKLGELVMDWEAWCAGSPWGHKELDRTDKVNRTEVKINSEGLGHILILLFISQLLIEKELFFGVQGYVKHEGPSPTRIKLMPPALGAGSLILWISGKF